MFIIAFLLVTPIVNAEDCDWKVEVLADNIFENETSFEFRYFINKIEGEENTNINLNRTIEDVYGNVVKSYQTKTFENIANHKTTSKWSPNLNEGVYLIKGEIFTECNDTNLENNKHSKLIMVLPEGINQDYTKLVITEFMPNPLGNEDDEWVELYNSGDNAINLEGLILNDDYGEGIEISNINIEKNNTIIPPKTYLTIHKKGNGKLTLANDGLEKVQLFYEDILLDEVSYSNTKEGLSWSKLNDQWILTLPTPSKENHIEEIDLSSKLTIDNVYLGSDDKARFGDSLRVRVTIYKGDTSKYNLDIYLIDKDKNQVSKRSEINIEDKFMNYTLIVPLQIIPNCNMKYNNGTYEIVLKGLSETVTEEIEIEGITSSLCETIKIKETSTKKTTKSQDSSEIEQETTLVNSAVTYKSSDIKTRDLGIYFFSAVLILLIIYLIFKKNL